MHYKRSIISCVVSMALLSGCNNDAEEVTNDNAITTVDSKVPYFQDWPKINSAVAVDPSIEAAIATILEQMTLAEKVGQMIQPDLREVTVEEAKQYKLGSLLNGGGAWPNDDKYATAADWAEKADEYYDALAEAYEDRPFKIPFMWATDAVHGHNNVYRATVFPHNIGLGAANNPELIYEIGIATAQEIVATGLDWTFAPTVAAPRDYRWGRVYEGYSEDPEIIYQFAGQMVAGLQGGSEGLKGQTNVISNVKHWVGDGGTFDGEDRGENHYSEEYLRNIHATGYFAGLDAGAQVVMSSFNSWHNQANYDQTESGEYNYKLHGSKYLLNDILKDKMGFDGIIVTDWNGQQEITGCTASNCPEAVNAGNDVFMVTSRSDWQAFYSNVIDQVNDGTIAIERINDAVTRILRVKMRADLWNKPKPSQRELAGDADILGSDAHRALARQAVSESLVLLKNKDNILPLSKEASYIVTGSAANDIQKQTGGWSLTWQGTENTIEDDFPGATTLLMAFQDVVGTEQVFTNASEAPEDAIAIVVIGEDPYAEMFGDIKSTQTLAFSSLDATYAADLATVQEMKEAGHKVVTVFYSGRPLYVNEEINASDAFIAAWLPGTEAGGITDVLFANNGMDFTGRLSYSWPMTVCSTTINRHAPNIADYSTPVDGTTGILIEQDIEGEHKPLFPYGYGLAYASIETQSVTTDLDNIELDERDYGCGQSEPDTDTATVNLEIYGRESSGEFTARISGEANGWAGVEVSNGSETTIGSITTTPINYLHQQDAIHVSFSGESPAQVYLQTSDTNGIDKYSYVNADATLQFDIDMKTAAPESLILSTHCEWPCLGEVAINKALPEASTANESNWTTIKVPLSCLVDEGMDFSIVNTPFLLYSTEAVEFNLGEIRYVPSSIDTAADAISCDALQEDALPPLDSNEVTVQDTWLNLSTYQTTTDDWSTIEGHVTYSEETVNDETILSIVYNATSPESYKGIVNIEGDAQNLSNYVEGTLTFDLFIESYGEPANDGETATEGLVIKMESENGVGNDYLLPKANYAAGEWHTVITNINDLNTGSLDITTVNKPLALLASWGSSQAGFSFKVKNIQLAK
ncbi:putative glycoside hydrolase [Psychromonas sp. 14N.309.X.WAT.B.A12]|uniref:glycoside hydrolase family 3 protein n=1 Tax=Psychromonas sp. 14N.309.X.WAT.B.A12 TaxID=2998322 RepID=UPI0025B11A76|nr:glycoside hydrolase family 3 N-terminal domain-containing protein [Psychromonas sp. 14N.309.X.WAT.B.A12]MDN2663141.1 putative glycoside hydrolase [Psychromonas sp. 14N.309.X.WAT.B.A12]